MDDPNTSRGIFFTPAEIELIRTALRLLLATLGREEAEELEEVRALLARIEDHAA